MTTTKKPPISLKVGEVPAYPFVNSEFEVNIHLIDNAHGGNLKSVSEGSLAITLKLFYFEKPPRQCPEQLLMVIAPQNLSIGKSGTLNATVVLTELSMNHENKKFVIQASAEMFNGLYITPAVSEPMLVIRSRLRIQRGPSIPDIWYKDEGGRDKVIELTVHLCNEFGAMITDRKVPLKISLLYEGGVLVHNQDILKIADGNRIYIDESGTCTLRFRIDEVSKNHQRQSFQIQVAPDTAQFPLNNDISPDCCNPIEVRSKRNKRMRDRDVFHSNLSGMPGGVMLAGKVTNPHEEYRGMDGMQHGSGYAHSSTSQHDSHVTSSYTSSSANPEAHLNSIFQWSQNVLSRLQHVLWEEIGVDKTDGKVLYTMANPNSHIMEIITSYNESILQSFTYLQSKIMQSSINDDINASAAPSFGRHKSLIEIHNTTPKFFEESSKKTRFDYDTDDSSISRRQSSSSALDVGPPPPLVSNNSWEMPPQNPTLAKDDSLGFGFSFISEEDAPSGRDGDVYYMLAKQFSVDGKQMGVAAFDRNMNIVGFYDMFDSDGRTVSKLVRYMSYDFSFDISDSAKSILLRHLQENDPAVFISDQSTPDDAIIYAFTQEGISAV